MEKPTRKWWTAYAALMGKDSKQLGLPIKEASKPKIDIPLESYEQSVFVVWLERHGIPFFAIPNGGKRDRGEAYNLIRQGLRAGVPDLCIPRASGTYHGLFIEMKRRSGGVISDSQREWIELLRREGYCAVVAKGSDEAIAVVQNYMLPLTT